MKIILDAHAMFAVFLQGIREIWSTKEMENSIWLYCVGVKDKEGLSTRH